MLGRRRRDAEWMWGLRGVPPAVMWFQWRARQLAYRTDEMFSFMSATRPSDLRTLLECARGAKRIVELGTGTGWAAISLALDDRRRRILTYDTFDREPQRYLQLVGPDVRARIEFVVGPGSTVPDRPGTVDLLYIDSSHEREQTIAEVRAWAPHLRPGAPVLLDDYVHSEFQGVREAVAELGLDGQLRGKVFVHRHRGGAS